MLKHLTILATLALCFLALGIAPALAESESAPNTPPDKAEDVEPIEVEDKAPEVELRTVDDDTLSLEAALEGQKAVLVFYRGGWCMYCNMQLAELRNITDDLAEQGYRILAISPDLPENLEATVEEEELDYTLLSDAKAEAARAFGIAFRVDADTRELYAEYGIDLEAASGESHHLLPVPAVFLVDEDGVIRYRFYDPDYTERLSNEDLLEAAGRY